MSSKLSAGNKRVFGFQLPATVMILFMACSAIAATKTGKPAGAAPFFDPPTDKWNRFESTETMGQPMTFFEFRKKPGFRVIHYRTWQVMNRGEQWNEVLKRTCSLMIPQLSTALSTNVSGPKNLKIGPLNACLVRIQGQDGGVTDHYVFLWRTREELAQGGYEGHSITVLYPPNYLAEGHDALERFFASLKVPPGGKQ